MTKQRSTLDERIARAEREISTWPQEKRNGMQLQGTDPYRVRDSSRPRDTSRMPSQQTSRGRAQAKGE